MNLYEFICMNSYMNSMNSYMNSMNSYTYEFMYEMMI